MTKELTVKNLYGIRGEITHRTDSNVLVVTGKSGDGKSSFVNSFVHIFAHKAVKGGPGALHQGMLDGEATYTDHERGLSFTRPFKNGQMKSVEIRATDGAKYSEPTAILKKSIGTTIVDLSDFLSVDESKRRDLIMSKATFPDGFDLQKLTTEQATAEENRKLANAEKTRLAGALASLTPPAKNTPDVEVSSAELRAELRAAHEHNTALANRQVEVDRIQATIDAHEAEITRLRAAIDQRRAEQERLELSKQDAAAAATGVEVDVETIEAKLANADTINAAVRAKQTFVQARADYDAAETRHKSLDADVKRIKQAKFDGLAAATFPHPLLSVDDEYVLWDGVPFSNVNSAGRALAALAVSTAGVHDAEELRLVILKEGDWLDDVSLDAANTLLTERGFFGLIDRGRPDMPTTPGIDVIELEDGQLA
jgi:hypothetical protein